MKKKDSMLSLSITEDFKKFLKNKFTPTSTYRIQLHPEFMDFSRAANLVPYLSDLGIQAVYLSPCFETCEGSEHGYDLTHPSKLNDDLGGWEGFEVLVNTLKQHEMGLILDVVPNHMGITGSKNKFWMDVLENGQASEYSKYFDIQWNPANPDLQNKILLPMLGGAYGEVLEKGEIQIDFLGGAFYARYWENRFPLDPNTYGIILDPLIPILSRELGDQHVSFLEFLHILMIFKNLPDRFSREKHLKLERCYESKLGKERMVKLMEECPVILGWVQNRLAELNGLSGQNKTFDELDQLLDQQVFRLSHWRVAADEINYRRFFNINGLAAVCMESPEVFDLFHKLIGELYADGKIQGLRVDHPDGLYDPAEYFEKLQIFLLTEYLFKNQSFEGEIISKDKMSSEVKKLLNKKKFLKEAPAFVAVEKILERKEELPEGWRVCGTTGYDFLNALNGVYVHKENEKPLTEIYESFIGQTINDAELIYEKKKLFALAHMASEVGHLSHRLMNLAKKDRYFRDFTLPQLTVAIRETIACFPVYRTYIHSKEFSVSERDRKYIHIAIEKAKRKTPALSSKIYDFLKQVLLLEMHDREKDYSEYHDFVMRFQQITAPIQAKGIEDTAFYIDNCLTSMNEVGGNLEHFGISPSEFHTQNLNRLKNWSRSMIATSTHDTKRSEDVRMRINVISEVPELWQAQLKKWTLVNEKYKTTVNEERVPDKNTEYFIYQMLLGVWPDMGKLPADLEIFFNRVWVCLEKSLREAKVYTNWIEPNIEYEDAVKNFLEQILTEHPENSFFIDFLKFQAEISKWGLLNSLSALNLKIASPGVLDVYQGTEYLQLRLMDPDNRTPVNYALNKKSDPGEEFGIQKFYQYREGLRFRREYEKLFLEGGYVPLEVSGEKSNHIIAFMRKRNQNFVIALSARFFSQLNANKDADFWKDTAVLLPEKMKKNYRLTELYSKKKMTICPESQQGKVFVKDLLGSHPAALWFNMKPSKGKMKR